MVCAKLQAPTTYVSRFRMCLRSRLSLANIICSQATGHHSFVPRFHYCLVPFRHACPRCPVLFRRIMSASTVPVRKSNHYFANLCEKSKLLLSSRSFFLRPVPFLRIVSAPCPFVPSLSQSVTLVPVVPFFSRGLHPRLITFCTLGRLHFYLILFT